MIEADEEFYEELLLSHAAEQEANIDGKRPVESVSGEQKSKVDGKRTNEDDSPPSSCSKYQKS